MQEQLLTIDKVKKILGVSRSKVYSFFKDDEFPLPVVYISERNPRVKKTDLYKWIEEMSEFNREKDEMRYDHLLQDLEGGE